MQAASSDAVCDNELEPSSPGAERQDALIGGGVVPVFCPSARGEFQDGHAGERHLAFEHGKFAAADEEVAAKGLDRGDYLGAVFVERLLVLYDLVDDAVGFHRGLPRMF